MTGAAGPAAEPKLSAVPDAKLSVSGSGRFRAFTIRGVMEIKMSVRFRL
jgi:hypothetical protein